MMKITRRLEFDYGHRVLNHESKCANLHGHRGVVEVTIQAPELDAIGRVVDFGAVKVLVGTWIDSNWDHNMLLHKDDPLISGLRQPIESHEHVRKRIIGREPYIMRYGNPTAENIARELFEIVSELLQPPLQVIRVRFHETPNCYADYEG